MEFCSQSLCNGTSLGLKGSVSSPGMLIWAVGKHSSVVFFMMYFFEPVSLPDMVLLLQGIRQTHDNHFLLHRQNIQSEFSSFHPDVLIRLRCNLCSWRKTWSEVQRHKGHVGSIIPEQSSERASSEEACAVLLIHGDAVHLRLLKCRSPQGLKFCISSSFQMSVASLNGLTSRSRCVRKGQVVNSSSGVMRSTECHIQGVQTVWIWTGYLISCRLFSSVRGIRKSGGCSIGRFCKTISFIHVKHFGIYLVLMKPSMKVLAFIIKPKMMIMTHFQQYFSLNKGL